MTRSPQAELLDEMTAHARTDVRPWGFMRVLDAPGHDLTVKFLTVFSGSRTSLQRHDRKDEVLVILDGTGSVESGDVTYRGGGSVVRILPGTVHQVTGPLTYLEVSSYDDDTDTVRLADDYGRSP